MAIYNNDLQELIKNFNHFKSVFLDSKKCIFTDKIIFTRNNIDEFRKQIIVGFDPSKRSSVSKYRDQIKKGMLSSDTFNLFFANLYFLYDLARNMEKKKKVNRLCFYLECDRFEFNKSDNITDEEIDNILDEINYDRSKIEDMVSKYYISNSPAYNTNMYFEINFIFGFLEKIINNNVDYREIINNLEFKNLVDSKQIHSKVINKFVARNALLYLFYPEENEPILSYSDKEKIVTYYKGSIVKDNYEQLDKDLFEIRNSLEWMDNTKGFYNTNEWTTTSISHNKNKRKKLSVTIEDIPSDDLGNIEPGDVREAIIKARVGQSTFRDKLLNKYHKCCICGIVNNKLLIASHIKPWSECENGQERTDFESNGLLLCPNHDKLFDKGYITFNDDGTINISNSLNETDYKLFNIDSNSKLNMSIEDKMKRYLKYHRDYKFINNEPI